MERHIYWKNFDFSKLKDIGIVTKRKYNPETKKQETVKYNDAIIMADTETSKRHPNLELEDEDCIKYLTVDNYVVCWTIAIRSNHENIVVLHGRKPSEYVECMKKIQDSMVEDAYTICYFHNLSYDWVFLRQFIFKGYGYPDNQLNTNPHYPISIEWNNAKLIIRDSLILAQRGISKWGKDMEAEHAKLVGSWDYDKIRTQTTELTTEELEYAENDVLVGVECLDALMTQIEKTLATIPLTATGIVRDKVNKIARKENYHQKFLEMAPTYTQLCKLKKCYHGGYTHGNRNIIDFTLYANEFNAFIECRDFASSYPYCLLAYKYPCSKFKPINATKEKILKNADKYAFYFKMTLIGVKVKDTVPMPALQVSKCEDKKLINPIIDNGRIISCDYCEIWLTEQDLFVIEDQYEYEDHIIEECEFADKDYLPKWLRDFIFQCFIDKTMLKGCGVAYQLAKSIINAIYGMFVQDPAKEMFVEDYETGSYEPEKDVNLEASYIAYLDQKSTWRNYAIGVWCTAYAFRNLFELGKCCEYINEFGLVQSGWLYSDTDSCYGINWNEERLNAYNENCKELIRKSGYGPVINKGKEYWLGVAEYDKEEDTYSEFKVCGAKRYCGRHAYGKKDLKITVAGVPKKGVKCLNDNINNFRVGFVFKGIETEKKTHKHVFVNMWVDDLGNECADYIDLTPCDYKLQAVYDRELEDFAYSDYIMSTFEEV